MDVPFDLKAVIGELNACKGHLSPSITVGDPVKSLLGSFAEISSIALSKLLQGDGIWNEKSNHQFHISSHTQIPKCSQKKTQKPVRIYRVNT